MPRPATSHARRIARIPDLTLHEHDESLTYVQGYLKRFGYLDAFEPGTLDEATSGALKTFQKRYSIDTSGNLDAATRSAMQPSRCALPDIGDGPSFSTTAAWDRTTLTYAFGPGTADVAGTAELDAVRRAFATWQNASALRFTETTAGNNPDVLIDWRAATDPDCPADMTGGVLAHADYPPGSGFYHNDMPRPVHFDDSENSWVVGAVSGSFDVETVALHEIGHIIGLQHSDVVGSVMWPNVSDNATFSTLQPDDMAGVNQLYPALPDGPAAAGNDMRPGEILRPGGWIQSTSGRYTFIYQTDGNLVLYDQGWRPLWASNTHGRPTGVVIMQGDGNLVMYAPNGRTPIWSSDTWRHPGSGLVLQDDGNVVIYRPDGQPVWATNTWFGTGPVASGDDMLPGELLHHSNQIRSANGAYQLIYQTDGNLVLYGRGRALWASGTDGRTDGWTVFQGDGNLVVYGRNGAVHWAANVHNQRGSRLVLQDDGNLVIYRPDGHPIWATDTWR